MIITISTTLEPATDLGFLLHKHPGRLQSYDLSMGTAHVFYPEATDQRCTAALMLEVDPVGLVRGATKRRGDAFALGQYVNDRPYAASSMLSVAITKIFRTAMTGRCDARPELAERLIPLQLHVPALPCSGGPDLVRRLFGPLGWQVEAATAPLDPEVLGWGDSRYVDLRLSGEVRLADALNHLYVLLPVLDDAKHYWVSPDEVDKLVRAGGGWLAGHPERTLITERYLRRRGSLTRVALARLAEADDTAPEALDDADAAPVVAEETERRLSLATRRREAVLSAVRGSGARRVGDLGCGEGTLVAALLAEREVDTVVAVDVSARTLEQAARKLRLEDMSAHQRSRLELFQSSLTYRDDRLTGLDAAVLMEVVEHVDLPRLAALERCVFGFAAPATVVVTTPNVEYNVRFATLPAGTLRHRDHRFEWTRAEFSRWASEMAGTYGYAVVVSGIGDDDPEVGAPSQLAVFTRITTAGAAA